MKHEELILKYFNKTATEVEEREVALLLDTDTDFKAIFDEHKNMQMAYKINETEDLKAYLNTLDSESPSLIKRTLSHKIIVLATACCLIIGAFYFLNNSSSNLYTDYFDVYPNVLQPVVRGEVNTNNNAFNLYENKLYDEAEQQFKTLLNSKTDYNIEFYYAMSLLNQDKIEAATTVLNGLKSKTHDFKAEVFWYSALIQIKLEDFEKAKTELKALEALKSDFKSQETKILLEKL